MPTLDDGLPDAMELQSIIDYTRSPDTTHSAAIDPVLLATPVTNEAGQLNFLWYWTGTTHARANARPGDAAAYIAFGRALGYMNGSWQDVHGAGAQRSDPKSGDPDDYPYGRGPQGDAIRIFNFVRLVRDAGPIATTSPVVAAFSFSPTQPATEQAVHFTDASTGAPTAWSWDFDDGSSSHQQNPDHTYTRPGTYTVALTVSNATSSDATEQRVTVAARRGRPHPHLGRP